MTFIQTVPEDEASGAVKEMYGKAEGAFGYLPNMVRPFSHRPDVLDAWETLLGSIKQGLDVRRYELVTLAAARALRSSYCMLAHGSVLLNGHFDGAQLKAIAGGDATDVLDDTDRAIMRFAEQVVRDATAIGQSDIDGLKSHGLTDAEIFDITAAAAVRCFFSKTLDALGVRPDAAYNEFDDGLRQVLTVGREIARPTDKV